MQASNSQLVQIRQPSPGVCSAEVVGLPEIRATAASPEEAVQKLVALLEARLSSGQLVQIELRPPPPTPRDPNDPLEQEFLKDLERYRREDSERAKEDDDRPCSDSCSTPTT